jgi:hypothetical protein
MSHAASCDSARIEQQLHAVAWQQLAARGVLGASFGAATDRDLGDLRLQVGGLRVHRLRIRLELGAARIEPGLQNGHRSGPDGSRRLARRRQANGSRAS